MPSSVALRRLVPAGAKPAARALLDLVDPPLRWRTARRHQEAMRLPPRSLRARVGEPDPERFLRHGAVIAQALREAAHDHGQPIGEGSVLDFGCGCGRTLRHLGATGARLHGCDVDGEAVRWTATHLEGVMVDVTGFHPPLPYADFTFDVVYSVSTLTHMARDAQDAWLVELARVLVPGGLALLSVHGPFTLSRFQSGEQAGTGTGLLRRLREVPPLESVGFAFEPYEDRTTDPRKFPGIDAPYGLSFHSEAFIREHWSPWFDVLELRPRALIAWQDLVVLRRP